MAAGVEVTRLINNATLRLPGATLTNLQQELFMVMDEFFKTSNVWQEDIPITIPANDPAGTVYVLAPGDPAIVDKLMWVFEKPSTTNQLRGPRVGASMQVPGELTLEIQPSIQTTINATVALTVQDPVNRDGYVVFPLWVIQKYGNVILDGLLGKMMTQPNKPWTNAQMSVFHLRKFETGKAHARIDGTRNNTYGQQAWRFPGFSRGSQRGRGFAPPQ